MPLQKSFYYETVDRVQIDAHALIKIQCSQVIPSAVSSAFLYIRAKFKDSASTHQLKCAAQRTYLSLIFYAKKEGKKYQNIYQLVESQI
jgi:hypothetical protein